MSAQSPSNTKKTSEESGRILTRPQSVAYGIVEDHVEHVTRQVPLDEPPPLAENSTLTVIGKPIPRLDAREKVTGTARYTSDVQLPGMLYARRIVSTVPHARVTSIDTSEAERVPGVRAIHLLDRVLLQATLRNPATEAPSRYPMIRYTGQPLGAVAAETQRAA